jgi:hypothetical protein
VRRSVHSCSSNAADCSPLRSSCMSPFVWTNGYELMSLHSTRLHCFALSPREGDQTTPEHVCSLIAESIFFFFRSSCSYVSRCCTVQFLTIYVAGVDTFQHTFSPSYHPCILFPGQAFSVSGRACKCLVRLPTSAAHL